MRRKLLFDLFLSLTFCIATACASDDNVEESAPSANPKHPTVSDLEWLAGHWIHRDGGRISEEVWIEPRGGVMLGVNRTVRGASGAEFEFLRIAETNDGVIYFASPSGKPPTPFRLTHVEKDAATFENPKHDFPQRIIYRRQTDALTATIEGDIGGEKRTLQWTWRKNARETE